MTRKPHPFPARLSPRLVHWLAVAVTAVSVLLGLGMITYALAADDRPLPPGLMDPGAAGPLPSAPGQGTAGGGVRGQLRPRQHTVLAAGIPGRIDAFPVEIGQPVNKGDALVIMDCAPLDADADVARARIAAAAAKDSVNRQLAAANNISGLEVDLARAELAVARAELRRIDARRRFCTVKAPFSGVVVGKRMQAFQHVPEGEALLDLVDNATLEVEVVVPSGWLARLGPGTVFTLTVDETGQTVSGTVARTEGRVDPVSQTVRLIGVLDTQAASLLAGMSGSVAFPP